MRLSSVVRDQAKQDPAPRGRPRRRGDADGNEKGPPKERRDTDDPTSAVQPNPTRNRTQAGVRGVPPAGVWGLGPHNVDGNEKGPPKEGTMIQSSVARAGVEPATFHFSGERYYQLSYLAVVSLLRLTSDPDGTRTRDLRRDRAAR